MTEALSSLRFERRARCCRLQTRTTQCFDVMRRLPLLVVHARARSSSTSSPGDPGCPDANRVFGRVEVEQRHELDARRQAVAGRARRLGHVPRDVVPLALGHLAPGELCDSTSTTMSVFPSASLAVVRTPSFGPESAAPVRVDSAWDLLRLDRIRAAPASTMLIGPSVCASPASKPPLLGFELARRRRGAPPPDTRPSRSPDAGMALHAASSGVSPPLTRRRVIMNVSSGPPEAEADVGPLRRHGPCEEDAAEE